jgi:prepilin-type N-terminal cleavage/methylation domain-containing protein
MSRNGFTLIEALIALFMMGLVFLGLYKFVVPNVDYFRHMNVRQQSNSEAQRCIATIRAALATANPSSVLVRTPADAPPNSFISFTDLTGKAVVIKWDADKQGSVVMELQATPTLRRSTILGTHVTALMFTLDGRDPGVIAISLRMDRPLNAQAGDGQIHSVFIPNQVVRLAGS